MPEITKTDVDRPAAVPAYIWVMFGSVAVIVYFFGLNIPLVGPDEPRYAQVAREMLESGDWITPTLAGHHWFEKPALLYWLQIGSYKLFGVSEFAARLGPALFGLGTVASLWLLGRSVERSAISTANNEQRTSNQFANLLALVAATTLGILVFSRGASFDIMITFPITAALVSFFIYDRSQKQYLPLVLFYVFIGIALLAKGLIGIVFPFAIVVMFYLLSRRMPGRTFFISTVWGALLALAIASIWYWPMYQRYGSQFIDEFFIQHHFQRFTSNKYKHPQPFYFFIWVLPLMTLPWMPFFFAALWRTIKGLIRQENTDPTRGADNKKRSVKLSPSPLFIFAICWMVVPLVFFSLSGSKLPGYILPAVPGAIIITAVYLFEKVSKSNRWRNVVLAIAGTTLIGSILLLAFVVPGFAERDSVKSLINASDERGYSSSRILTLHNISHNAEFYAAGRLVRDADGKQRYLSAIREITDQVMAHGGGPLLVLVPVNHLAQLTSANDLRVEVIKENGELAIAAVSAK